MYQALTEQTFPLTIQPDCGLPRSLRSSLLWSVTQRGGAWARSHCVGGSHRRDEALLCSQAERGTFQVADLLF